ncbi:MAG TPA: hypothetical protein ENI20_16805, partial [Bacteroides sp.]|nr:hypothetical protein [Bacteroides sp.]
MIRTSILLAALLILSIGLMGQSADNNFTESSSESDSAGTSQATSRSTPVSTLKFAGFPIAGYTPETRIMGGVYTQFLFGDPAIKRPSSVGLSLLLSQNRQFSIN